jgi:adenine-specific DNA-methyltransferase
MHKRLRLAKTLLSDSGMFFCSIDDNEVGPLRLLLDEVFGEDNFINCITVKTKSSAGASGGGEDKKLKKNVEYLLFYAKNRAEFSFNPLYVYRPLEDVILEKEDEGKQFEYRKILANEGKKEKFKVIQDGGGNDIIIYKHSKYEISSIPDVMKSEGLTREVAYYKYFDKVFRTTNAQTSIRTRVAEATEGVDTLFSIEYVPRSGKNKGQVSRSHYMGSKTDLFVWLADTAEKKTNRIMKREKLGTLWSDLSWNGLASEGGVKFENGKKPIAFLKRILQLHPKQDLVAMDFFAGSGSLGHAVLDLNSEDGQNRTFVLATNNEKSSKVPEGICVEVTYPRMQNVIKGHGRKEGIQSNLRYFRTKLVSSKHTDSNKKYISQHVAGILSVKEKCFEVITENDNFLVYQGVDKQMGIVFNSDGIDEFKKHCANSKFSINVYVFSLGNDDHSEEFVEFDGKVSSVAIPKALMNAYLRAQRMIGGAK